MTERASGGNDITEKRSEAPKKEDAAQSGNENKTQDGATESIAVVKSKIREKNTVQGQQEDEAYSNTKTAKVVSSKISKLSKQKRGKSRSNEALETQENATDEIKTENVPPQDLNVSNSQYAQNESKTTLDMNSIVSKKSLLSKKSVAKSASRLIALTEDDDHAAHVTSNVTSKISIGANYDNEESHSTFVISHDAESQRENTINNVLENITEIRQEIIQRAPPVHVHERGNYMTSVSPSPIEDYPPPTKDQIELREKERREQRELRELREQKDRELKELKEKEQRELRELKEKEQREIKELKEQRELKELKEQKELKELREQKDLKDLREPKEMRELREKDPREPREARETREKDPGEPREARELRDAREAREHKELKEPREPKESRESKEPRDHREFKTHKEEEEK